MLIRNPLILKQLDRWASPLGAIAGSVIARLFWWRKPDPRTLIVRPGGMGDLILLCVACEEAGLPLEGFVWLIERRSEVWARHLKLDYLCYDGGMVGVLWKIAGRFQTVINSEQRFGLSQAVALAARARRGRLIGFDTNVAGGWADRPVAYDADSEHEVTEFSRLLEAVFETPPVKAERRRHRPATGLRMVGLSGLQSEHRAFSLEDWARFVEEWAGSDQFQIAGSPADRELALALAARFPRQAVLFDGNFEALCDQIAASREVFTVDGGFVHMASYYGVPVTALFTSGRDRKWAPLGAGSSVVRRHDLACQPCTWFGQVPACPNHYACKELSLSEELVKLG